MSTKEEQLEDLKATAVKLQKQIEALEWEPTLTPVSFESKGELSKALVDGRTFKTSGGITLMYEDNSTWLSPFRTMRNGRNKESMQGEWNSYWNLQEINAAPWYKDIPEEGVLCYVSDVCGVSDFTCASHVLRYDSSNCEDYPFKTANEGWKYAIPINQVS